MATREEQLEFIKTLAPSAIKSENKTKIPARLIIAQAALETGWGEHVIGEYNYFGMKYMKRHPKKVSVTTFEYINGQRVTIVADFADYNNLDEAVADYCWLLSSTSIYKEWYNEFMETGDLTAFVKNLASRYSTASAQVYSQTVMNIANSNLVKETIEKERKPNV